MANSDFQPQLPPSAPIWDYNKAIDLAPEKTYGIGGQIEIDANFTIPPRRSPPTSKSAPISIGNLMACIPFASTVAGQPITTAGSACCAA